MKSKYQNFAQYFDEQLELNPKKVVLGYIKEGIKHEKVLQELNLSEIKQYIEQFGFFFADKQIPPGKTVAIIARNEWEGYIIWFACLYWGVIPLFLSSEESLENFSNYFKLGQPTLLFHFDREKNSYYSKMFHGLPIFLGTELLFISQSNHQSVTNMSENNLKKKEYGTQNDIAYLIPSNDPRYKDKLVAHSIGNILAYLELNQNNPYFQLDNDYYYNVGSLFHQGLLLESILAFSSSFKFALYSSNKSLQIDIDIFRPRTLFLPEYVIIKLLISSQIYAPSKKNFSEIESLIEIGRKSYFAVDGLKNLTLSQKFLIRKFRKLSEKIFGLQIMNVRSFGISESLFFLFKSIGINYLTHYGNLECMEIALNLPNDNDVDSQGKLVPWNEYEIFDKKLIALSGPTLFVGYYNQGTIDRNCFDDTGKFELFEKNMVTDNEYFRVISQSRSLIKLSTHHEIDAKFFSDWFKNEKLIKNVYIFGDGLKFISAIFDVNNEFFFVDNLDDPKILELIQNRLSLIVERININLKPNVQIKKFIIARKHFPLNAQGKPYFPLIMKQYQKELEAIYQTKFDFGDSQYYSRNKLTNEK